jgi:hypothetical protein
VASRRGDATFALAWDDSYGAGTGTYNAAVFDMAERNA